MRTPEDEPPASRAVPAAVPDDDPGHEAVLALPAALGPVRPRPADDEAPRDVISALARVKRELAALVALAVAPAVLGLAGLLVGLALAAVCRFWDVRVKLFAAVGLVGAGLFVAVVYAWLRATRLTEAEDSGTRIANAWHALGDALGVLPVGVGWAAAAYLGFALVRGVGDDAS